MATADHSDVVWGVVFEIPLTEKPALDRAEGLRAGYAEKEVRVAMASGEIAATTYVATAIDSSLQPYDWYKAFVVAGAKEHGLPSEYTAGIEGVPSKADGDLERHEVNVALLTAALPDGAAIDDPLKGLAEISIADSRQASFVGALADQHAELALMTLTARAPKGVRQLYETAKNVSLYSYFVYRFHQVAESVAFQALEMALRARYKADEEEAPTAPLMLKRLMRLAHERGWLKDTGFPMLQSLAARRVRDGRAVAAIELMQRDSSITEVNLSDEEPTHEQIQAEMASMKFVEMLMKVVPDLRNGLAHGSTMLHPNSRYTLRVVCEAINQLYSIASARSDGESGSTG